MVLEAYQEEWQILYFLRIIQNSMVVWYTVKSVIISKFLASKQTSNNHTDSIVYYNHYLVHYYYYYYTMGPRDPNQKSNKSFKERLIMRYIVNVNIHLCKYLSMMTESRNQFGYMHNKHSNVNVFNTNF